MGRLLLPVVLFASLLAGCNAHLASTCETAEGVCQTDAPQLRPSGLALPPMGWNTWNIFGCKPELVNEKVIKEVADTIVRTGLRDKGYVYVNIDDCWTEKTQTRTPEDPKEELRADPQQFPSGMKALGEYIHSQGLKFGIYSDCGTKTCGGYPGSLGFEETDAQTFANWGVDFLKLDGCYAEASKMRDYYSKWSSALVETGRDIVFSCSWPAYVGGDKALREFPWGYISRICNLWRLYDDINPSWGSLLDIMKHWRNTQDYLITAHGPSALNDPDMLEVGNPEVPATQARAQMSVWSVLAAPLLMGHDVRKMDAQSLAILSNDEVIAVNQDLLVRQGKFVRFLPSPSSSAGEATTLAVWRRELFNGDVAVAVVNEGEEKQSAEISWSEDLSVDPKTPFRIRDLWGHLWVTAGARGGLKVSVDPHDAVFLRFVPDPLAPSASSVRGHSRGVFSSWASELSGEGVSRTVLPSEEIGSRVDLAALAARSDPAEIRWREEGRARWQAAAKSGERKEERETGDEEGTKREERERKEPSVPVVLEM